MAMGVDAGTFQGGWTGGEGTEGASCLVSVASTKCFTATVLTPTALQKQTKGPRGVLTVIITATEITLKFGSDQPTRPLTFF